MYLHFITKVLLAAFIQIALIINATEPPSTDDLTNEFSSSSAPLSSLTQEPSSYVHGCVNVISGMFSICRTDLISHHGVNPLIIESVYFGNSIKNGILGQGWTLNHNSKIKKSSLPKKKGRKFSYDIEEFGCATQYTGLESRMPISPHSYLTGVSNTSRGTISGQSNIKNNMVSSINKRSFFF
jgi:hypothetical protein